MFCILLIFVVKLWVQFSVGDSFYVDSALLPWEVNLATAPLQWYESFVLLSAQQVKFSILASVSTPKTN